MSGSTVILGTYLIYAVAAMALFIFRPARQAALIAYCGGWLLLPVAVYDPHTVTAEGFTLDIVGTALPSNLLLAKALVIPLAVLAGLAWRARPVLGTFRPAWPDAAMAAFCLTPFLPLAAGRIDAAAALVQAGYLAGVWGGSWLIGRLLLGDDAGRRALVGAMVVSGLCLVPVALVEGLAGPFLYDSLYGVHPFHADGVSRYVGARPLALFEHGNQYGIWIAMAALAAVHMARRRTTRAAIAVAVLLTACAVASQSVGALILLLLGTIWLFLSGRVRRFVFLAAAVLLPLGAAAYISDMLPIERLAYHSTLGQKAMAVLKTSGRGSLSWRVHRDMEAMGTIHRAALTGYGAWDWWRPLKSHPWGFTLLLAGQFGLVSLALLTFALLAGPVRALWLGSAGVLPIIVILAAIDAQLNSFIYFNALLAASAMVGWRRAAADDDASPSHLSAGNPHVH